MPNTHPTPQHLPFRDTVLLTKLALDEALTAEEDARLTLLLSRDGTAACYLADLTQLLALTPFGKTPLHLPQTAGGPEPITYSRPVTHHG